MSSLASLSPALAEKFSRYELATSTLHLYVSGNDMNDVSFIIEGDTSLVVMEQPLYTEHIKEFSVYLAQLQKPVEKVFANFHICGITPYPVESVVMPRSMVAFSETPDFKGMMAYFEEAFEGKADLTTTDKSEVLDVPSTHQWAGVQFKLFEGAISDFPAAGVEIDNSAYYTHYAPISGMHMDEWVINSPQAIDATLLVLRNIEASGVMYILGSHSGVPSTMDDVTFQIDYLSKLKAIYESNTDAESFEHSLIATFPDLSNPQNVKAVAQKLYPTIAE